MKGSPLIATAVTIIVLLGLYVGMRVLILDDVPQGVEEHDHGSHGDEGEEAGGHDDSALETQVDVLFSSTPTVFRVVHPVTEKVLLEVKDVEGTEWSGPVTMSLEGHDVELLVEVEWATPGQRNFVQVSLSPENHATKQVALSSEENISEIAEFHW